MVSIAISFGGVDYVSDALKRKKEGETEKEKKEEYYKRIWEETKNWFPPNVSPVEREFYKNPDDPVLQEMVARYIEERTERARQLSEVLRAYFSVRKEELERLGELGVEFIYFWSPRCPYCAISEPAVRDLSMYTRVLRVNVDNPNTQEIKRSFGVYATPTLVAVKGNEVLNVWVGAFSFDNLHFSGWLREVIRRAGE